MKSIKYFLEFIIIKFFFLICKILGYKISSSLGYFIGRFLGPFFRSRSKILNNLENPKLENQILKEIKLLQVCGVTMEEYCLIIFF